MTYNEIARRALEKQGFEEWLGPKALEHERKIREAYLQEKHNNENTINSSSLLPT